MKLKISNTRKVGKFMYLEIKQYVKQPIGQRGNQNGHQELSCNKWKYKHNISKPVE